MDQQIFSSALTEEPFVAGAVPSSPMEPDRSPTLDRIGRKLATLRERDGSLELFGASAHEYALAPPVDGDALAAAEATWGVTLPEDYREFLLLLGAGGAGPGYGIFPLVPGERGLEWDGDGADLTSDLKEAFPHTKAWNMADHPIWDSQPKGRGAAYDAAYAKWDEEFLLLYWDSRWTTGAICICHVGCALRYWLVVTGPERGHVWYDGTADRTGLEPCNDASGKRLSFTAWYEEWLDRSLAKVEGAG